MRAPGHKQKASALQGRRGRERHQKQGLQGRWRGDTWYDGAHLMVGEARTLEGGCLGLREFGRGEGTTEQGAQGVSILQAKGIRGGGQRLP